MRSMQRVLRGAICLASACRGTPDNRAQTRLEAAIDVALSQRLGVGVLTSCIPAIPPCSTQLPDGTVLPIDVQWTNSGWNWHVRGLLITTDEVASYLRDELADLGANQDVRCAPRVRAMAAGERIECWLGRGGKAFVTVRADGTTSVELALDAAAAAARSENLTPEGERELERTSRALAHEDDDPDDDGPMSGPDEANATRDAANSSDTMPRGASAQPGGVGDPR